MLIVPESLETQTEGLNEPRSSGQSGQHSNLNKEREQKKEGKERKRKENE
jgi:hypothetical protein